MENKIGIYPAAALFNGRETYFNSKITEGLEELGYDTSLPQRDGFEFGNLTSALSEKLPSNELEKAVQTTIYLLDLGHFIPQKDVVLANMDEPLDPGVDVETTYSKIMGKFVLGFRTDVRSPYGTPEEELGGMHFIPGYQNDMIIPHQMSSRTPEEREEQMNQLTLKADEAIRENIEYPSKGVSDYVRNNPNMRPLLEGAEILFSGIEDLHSEKGLNEIAERYRKNKETLERVRPKIKNS